MALTNDYTIKNISDAWKLGGSNPISFLADDEVVSILDQYNKALDSGAEATARFLNSGTGNEFMDGFLRDLNGAPATMNEYQVAMNNATAQQKAFSVSTIATKAAVIALNAAVSLGLSIVLTSLIKTISEVIQAEENMKSSAKELGTELSNDISTIDNYKNKIEELKGVLGDNSSSFDDVAQARIDLMKIQDELIDKFGTEKGVIEDITEAIYGQTNALDDLSRDSYYKAKNEFNEKTTGEKFIDGLNQFLSFGYVDEDKTTSKMDKMVGQMESSLYHLKITGNEVLDELISKSYGLNIYDDMYGDDQHFLIMGSLDDIQEKLRGIQELSQDFDVSTSFENSLAEISNEVDSLLDSYQNLYDQYVLYEKILTNNPDNQYDEQFNLINKAKEEYNNALKSGDTDAIKKASDNFAQTLSSAIDLAMNNQDYDVADYFEDMYPEMQQLFGEWKFKLDFEPNTEGIQDKVSSSLDVLEGFSSEDILNFNPNVRTEEQISAYGELNNVAEEYGLTLQQLVNLLLEMGLVSSESYQNLVDKFGQDAVDKLTPEDLQIALTISTEEADKAIEEEKKKYEKLKAEFENTGLQDVVDDYDDAVKSSKEYVNSLDDIYKSYNGINNIDRDILYWDDETLENNRQFLEEMYGSYEDAVADLKGTWSTVLGTSENIDGVEIAYTQMLQTDHGLVPLTEDTFWSYFDSIFSQSWNEDGTFNAEKFIQLDAQGTDMLINGQMEHVANMIAAAEGQYMNGIKLTADDVIAIGTPGYDDDGNDLLPGNNSPFKGYSVHDVQAWSLQADYQLARVEEKAKETGNTVEGIWAKKDAIDDYADYGDIALQGLIKSKQQLEKDNETTNSTITSSIKQIATQLEPQFAKLGEAYKSIFTTDGFTLEDVDNSMLEGLRTSFAEIEEEVGVAFDSTKLESFFDALTKGDSTADQVQQAFNDLATAYLYSTDTLSNLNEETAEAIEKQLEELGVVNAHEVVYGTLNAETEALALQKQYLAQTGSELINVTSAEAIGFLNEAGASETARKYLMLLTAQEQIFNNSELNVTEKVAQLQELAQEYGDTALAASIAAKMTEASKSAATGGSYSFQDAFNDAKAEFEAAARTVEIDFSDIGTSGASKAGGEAGDAYVEAFEKELSELQDLRDRGVIDEKEYLDRLRALYIRYFADRKEYLDEYNKYEHEYLTGMKSLYDSALSGITKLMGSKIDAVETEKETTITALEEERDARLEVIDAQKEQLEAEIDLIDEQIEAKQDVIDSIQDEIDKMREANEERKRATDLQKAQYELERMMNQRTQLVYQGGQMVYKSDDEGIRDAREAVDDAKLEIEIAAKEKEIALIEDEIDLLEKQKEAIQEQIDALDKQADSIEKYYSKMIAQQEKYYDSLIKSMEEQKSKWEELAEVQEIAEAYAAVQQVFGELGYTVEDVLNGSSGAFEDFKEKYIGLMSDLNSTSSFADGLSYATDVAKEDLGSFLDKTQDVAQGLDDLSTKGEGLNAVSNAMNSANTSASSLKASTDGLNDNLSGISDSLTSIPSSEGIDGWVTGFTELGEAIKGVAQALGITEVGTVGSLVTALQDISNVSLGTEEEGVIGQFGLLKKAVDDVSSAISGGGSNGGENEASGDASNSKSASMSSGANGEGASGLLGAIEEIGTKTNEVLGETSEEEGGSGAIGKFTELKNAVDLVTQSIGTGEEEESEEAITLIGALQKQYEKAQLVLPEEKTLFDELLSSIQACVAALIEMASAIENMPTISGGGISVGAGHAEGTVGKAFANGTGKYKGLAHTEKNAVRSEYGQPELTVYPNGVAELTTEPVMSDLPKGTEIFNEEQTRRIMNNKGEIVGKAFASGTIQNPDGSIVLPNGSVYSPLPDDHPINVFFRNWEKKHMDFNESMITPMHSIQDHISEMVRGIDNINTNNTQNQQVVIGDINVNCPGITSHEVAKQISSALHREIGGIALEALQESSITR